MLDTLRLYQEANDLYKKYNLKNMLFCPLPLSERISPFCSI